MIMGRGSRSFLHLLFLVLVVRYTDGRVKSRWKRQVLPSTHVQVHSLNSNVSVSDTVKVVSAESRIDLDEKFLNASIWSTSSELLFDNFDTYVNYTAYNVEDVFKLQSIILQKKANRTQFSMVTNRTSDGETSFNERLDGSISLRVNDTNMGVQALNGSYALIDGQTWKENVPKKISVFSAIDDTDQERKLLIRAESHLYEVKIILNSAEVQIEYGPSMIQIDETYRHMKIFTNRRNITLDTTTSPFESYSSDLLVTCKDERTIATLSPNNTDVGISVGQYSRLEVDRGKGIMSLGSDAAISERVNVTSMHLQLDLEDDVIRANSNRSHIDMMGNLTKVGLTAAIHNLTVIGGVPRMILDTGNITIKVLTVEERAVLPSIVPPFITPKDNYDTLGPVQNETLNDRQSQGSEPNPFEEATENPEEKIQVTTLVANNEERLTSVAPELNDISSETSPEAKTTTVDNREVTSAITNPEESGVNGYDPFVQQIPDWLIHPTTTSLTSPIETTEWTDQSDSESTTGEADQTATSHQSETSPSAEIPTDAGPEETTFMPVTGEEGLGHSFSTRMSLIPEENINHTGTSEWIAVPSTSPSPSSGGSGGDVVIELTSTSSPPITGQGMGPDDSFPAPQDFVTNDDSLTTMSTSYLSFPTPSLFENGLERDTDFPLPDILTTDNMIDRAFPTSTSLQSVTDDRPLSSPFPIPSSLLIITGGNTRTSPFPTPSILKSELDDDIKSLLFPTPMPVQTLAIDALETSRTDFPFPSSIEEEKTEIISGSFPTPDGALVPNTIMLSTLLPLEDDSNFFPTPEPFNERRRNNKSKNNNNKKSVTRSLIPKSSQPEKETIKRNKDGFLGEEHFPIPESFQLKQTISKRNDFPIPDPLWTSYPIAQKRGEIDQQTDAVNEARSIDQIYIETTTDGFVIGQFAQPEFNHKQPSATAQSNQGTKMEATIDKVEFFTQAPPFPTSPGQSPFPEPETLAKKRTSRSINDALVMRLFVPDTVNISDPLFRKAMQDNLITAVQESVCGGDKQKRSTDEQDIGINLTNIGRDGEALSLHFIVFDDISGLRTNHSAVAEAMNLLGVARLSQDMHYPVMEVVHVNLDSSLVWLSLASACSVLLIFLFVLIGWKFSVHQKIKRRIIDQKMSKRTEAFQQKADDYY